VHISCKWKVLRQVGVHIKCYVFKRRKKIKKKKKHLQEICENRKYILACKISPKKKSHGWGDSFVSDIHVRRSVVTSAVD